MEAGSVFHGIQVRAHCAGFNEFAGRVVWDVQLRNTYKKDVDFAWAMDAQMDRAVAVRPGEVVESHHAAPNDCAAGLSIKVNEVREAGPVQGSAVTTALRPKLEGRWRSRDPEPFQKELVVSLAGKVVTTSFTSPNFSIQFSTPLPDGVSGGVSLEKVERK